MSEEKKPADEFMETAAGIAMTWIDITPFAAALEAEYQRGFDAGAKLHAVDQDDLKVAFQRGRDSYRDELLTRMDLVPKTANGAELDRLARQPITHDQDHKPIASGIEEIHTAPSAPEPDPPKMSISPGSGPHPTNPNRPEGIPSNFEMCRLALIDAGVPLTAVEIRDVVAKRWWPDVPRDWKASPFGFLGSGKLKKNADGKFILPATVVKPVSEAKADPQAVINRESDKRSILPTARVQAPMPAVRPTEGPRREVVTPGAKLGPPARGEGVHFVHRDQTVTLHQREVEIMVRLRAAMGSGHLDAKFLAGSIGIKSDAETTMKDFVSILNPKIAALGLQINFYKGFGFSMVEMPGA